MSDLYIACSFTAVIIIVNCPYTGGMKLSTFSIEMPEITPLLLRQKSKFFNHAFQYYTLLCDIVYPHRPLTGEQPYKCAGCNYS